MPFQRDHFDKPLMNVKASLVAWPIVQPDASMTTTKVSMLTPVSFDL